MSADDRGVRAGGDPVAGAGAFGPNAWLVEDMYDRFLADPTSVSDSWREFFADYRPAGAPPPTTAAPVPAPAGHRARAGARPPRSGAPLAYHPVDRRATGRRGDALPSRARPAGADGSRR